ncbi:MAG: hypothetical protein HYY76_00790 [Acidobacteria bacterium]|nr:hypothetical protein [Acidobacteriota bacterium]
MKIRIAVCLALATAFGIGPAGARQQASAIDYGARPASAVRYLKVSNPGEDDRLGIGDPLVGVTLAMSADGNTLAVSTPHEDSGATDVNGNQHDESAWDSGAVYVFVRSGASWTQQAYIKASNAEAFDQFGSGLAVSADGATMAVAGNGEDSGSGIDGNQQDNSVRDSGAVYIY